MSLLSEYRAKAAKYSDLSKAAVSPSDAKRFKEQEHSLITLADNEQWMIDHRKVGVLRPGDQLATTEDEKDAGEGGRQATQ